ncbi:glycosyltransferase [Desulfobaculum senezii]
MNIVFVNATRRFGGVKAWTLDLAAQLEEMGHKAAIFCRRGAFLDKAQKAGLDAHAISFGFDYNPLTVYRFVRYFTQHAVDVVVVNVGKDLRTAGVAARLCGIPVIHRVGLPRDMRDTPKVRNTHRFITPRILVPCEYIKDGLVDGMSFIADKDVAVIPTGKIPAPESPAVVRTPRQLAVTSQLNPDKGHAELLHALKLLKDRGCSFHLHVAGTGSAEKELRSLSDSLGLTEEITWYGFVADVRQVLRKADIFVLPSFSEGLPNTLLEAMSQGLAPVARNVGGISEAWPSDIPALSSTLIAKDKGPDAFADALQSLISLDNEGLFDLRGTVWSWFKANHSLERRSRQFVEMVRGMLR